MEPAGTDTAGYMFTRIDYIEIFSLKASRAAMFGFFIVVLKENTRHA